MNRLERILHEKILPKPVPQTRANMSHTWVLAGSGRSGTSWLAELLAKALDYRYLWEPFHPDRVPAMRRALPARSPFLPPEEENSALAPVAEKTLRGSLNHPWVNSRSPLWRFRPYQGRVVKDIRINGLLPWLVQHFPEPRYGLVFRHPYAVTQSRVKLGWDAALDHYRRQPYLMEGMLAPYRHLLERAHTPWEQQSLRWCIETYLPLQHLQPGQVAIYFYEDMLGMARENPARLLEHLLGTPGEQSERGAFQRSSSSKTGLNQAWQRLAEWETWIDPERMACTLDYLQAFGLDTLYGQEAYARVKDAQTLLKDKRLK